MLVFAEYFINTIFRLFNIFHIHINTINSMIYISTIPVTRLNEIKIHFTGYYFLVI